MARADSSSQMHVLRDAYSFADTGLAAYADGNVTVTGGQLRVAPIGGDGTWIQYSSWDGRNSSLTIRFVQNANLASAGNSVYLGFGFQISPGNAVYILVENVTSSTLYFQEIVADASDFTSAAFDASTDKWFRIATSGTTLTWLTSADGVNWTTRRTKTSTLDFTSVLPTIYGQIFGTVASPGAALFDNLNLQPDPAAQWVAGAAPMGVVDWTLPLDAGTRYGWGTPDYFDDWTTRAAVDTYWNVYNGAGHAGNGTRSPAAITVAGSILTITGTAGGQSGGMMKLNGETPPGGGKYEVRMRCRSSAESEHYHPVLLLWPVDASIPGVLEVDFCEILDTATRVRAHLYINDGDFLTDTWTSFNGPCTNIVLTEWHNYAVDWTSSAIVTYIDGVEIHRFTDTAHFPRRETNLCIQLDNFSSDGSIAAGAIMDIDWVKIWKGAGGGAALLPSASLYPGATLYPAS